MEALKGQGVSQSEADELLAEWDANRDGVIRHAAAVRVLSLGHSGPEGRLSGRAEELPTLYPL